jgi:hypothetical protein
VELQKILYCHSNLSTKNKAGIATPRLQRILQIVVTKTAWYWHKNRHINPWNRIDINPCIYMQLIFNRDAKNTQGK